MANIDHKEQLDNIDVLSVLSYRLGWLCLAASLCYSAYSAYAFNHISQAQWLIALPVALLSFNLHLYIKSLRFYIQTTAWGSLWLMIAYAHWHMPVLGMLALGSAYLVFSALSFKESFCFKLGALRWLGFVFAIDWLLMVMGYSPLRLISLLLLAAACVYISLAKCRQPLHYDIGDKSKYQH